LLKVNWVDAPIYTHVTDLRLIGNASALIDLPHVGRMASFVIMFIQWLNAVRKEFKTLMTGSLLLTVMGLAQRLWQVPIPRWCYSVVVVAFLTWAFYQAWLKERHIRQENINALEHRLQNAEAAATHLQRKLEQDRVAEWKALAEQFQSVSRYFRADWQHGGMGIANGKVIETWRITGLADAPERKQCEAADSIQNVRAAHFANSHAERRH
jgi:hypothetical protein